jgi:hypothetical protein
MGLDVYAGPSSDVELSEADMLALEGCSVPGNRFRIGIGQYVPAAL